MKAMLEVCTPTSIAFSGTSASITGDGGVEFTACSSLSLNGCFTADYDNYMVVVQCVNTAGLSTVKFRWRASGTDEASGSNYYTFQDLFVDGTSVTGSRSTTNEGRFFAVGDATYDRAGATCYLFGPYLAQPTATRSVNSSSYNSAIPRFIYDLASTHSLSNQYDGITIYPSNNSFTGLLTVFGFTQ